MLSAILWSALATSTLLIGMALAYQNILNLKWTGLIMAFGAGAIISVAAYQLVLGSIIKLNGNFLFIALSMMAGALTFYFADKWVDHLGGEQRLDFDGGQSKGSGTGILLGSLLDGVPESLVLGLSFVHSQQVSIAFVFAIAISNIPQGLGGTVGMISGGWRKTQITRLWLAVCGLSILAAAFGFLLGKAFLGTTGARIDAFAAGSLLMMLTDSMIPEAFEHAGREAGLLLVVGFGVALAITLFQVA